MIVADTSVWARAFLNNDSAQARVARNVLGEGRNKGGVFVPLIVLAELSGVLRAKKWERARVLDTLESLLQTRGVHVESPSLVRDALAATREGKGGFADHLVAMVGFAHGAREVVTFDDRFSRALKIRRIQ